MGFSQGKYSNSISQINKLYVQVKEPAIKYKV